MNLFYQPDIQSGTQHLDREESRHAITVLRMERGSEFYLTDGKGSFYTAKITTPDTKKCEFKITDVRQSAKKEFRIHLAIAPTKNTDRTEWFVEKAIEMGVDEISFLHCKNSERKVLKMERIEKIAISALKQSQQAWMPKLHALASFNEILVASADQKFIAFVDSQNPAHLKSLVKPKGNYLVLIGPEGDLAQRN